MKIRFIPLAVKANIVFIAIFTLGLGGVAFLYYTEVNQTITTSVHENLQNQSQILYSAIQNFMLPGEAPLAVHFFKDIQEINPLYNVHLYRANGIPAFSDNATIEEVNRRIQKNRFSPRTIQLFPPLPSAPSITLQAVTSRPARDVFIQKEREGRLQVLIYKPLINLPKCTACHGAGDEMVAVFPGEQAPLNAYRAALEIQRTMYRETHEFQGLGVGIGLTKGELIMGMIGSEKCVDFTVIGDTVNTASRFCSAARQGQTIISESIFQSLPHSARVESPYRLKVKGKQESQRVYILKEVPFETLS